LLLLLLAGCQQTADPTATQVPAAAAEVPLVSTVRVGKGQLHHVIEQPAQIEAYAETALVARIPGAVHKVYADIGQRLKGPIFGRRGQVLTPGEVLAELWVPDLRQELNQKKAQLAQARAELAQARANLEVARAHIESAGALVHEAKAGEARAEAAVARWKSEYERLVKLAKDKVIDEQSRDETLFQYESAKAGLTEVAARITSAGAKLKESEAQRDKAAADVDAAAARIDVAEAEAARLGELVEYATIRAPYDCIVTRRNVDPSTFVQPGTGSGSLPLFVVASYDRVRLFVDVPEKDALLLKDGMEANLKVQAITDRVFKGKVTRQTWALDAKSRTLRVEIDLPNEGELLRPGMYAYASFHLKLPERPTLPVAAVVLQGDNAHGWQVVDGKAVKTPLLIGYRDGKNVEVLKKLVPASPGGPPEWTDLAGTEAFIVGDLGKLSDQQAVRVQK
jgi:multidrug efflux pump subunit AcrA (membrane-fusion protein)